MLSKTETKITLDAKTKKIVVIMEARLWGIRSHKIARISLFVCRRGANEEILTGKH